MAGILTGANMSGDLKDPQKSLPTGTILAQLSCSFIFMLLVFVYGGTTDGAVLRDKYVTATPDVTSRGLSSWQRKLIEFRCHDDSL